MATTLSAPQVERPQRFTLLRSLTHSYYIQKLIKTLFTVFVVTTFTFFLVRLLPGNPIEQMINFLINTQGISMKEAQDQAAALYAIDLDQPIYLQYLDYLGKTLRGDLGYSLLSQGTPVTAIILKFLPWTIFSVGTGLLLSFIVGMGLGMVMAYARDSWIDHALTVFASIFSSIPDYLVGLMLIVWLGIQWKLVPIAAMRGSLSPNTVPGLNWAFFADALFHAALPISTYFITTVGRWMLSMKSSTISTLGEDYVTVAKARGLRDWRITTAYVGRNASLPLFTQMADAASPVALFTIGMMLARQGAASTTSSRQLFNGGNVVQVVFYKLALHPLLVLITGHAAMAMGLSLDPFALTVLVLAAALPSASNVPILAERFGADASRIARIVMLSTVAAFGSFPIAVALAHRS